MTSLNQNELEALRILWEHGELKPAEIQAHFSWPIENATLRSVLVNLVEKKHIARRLQGKAFFYAARVPKATLLQSTFQTLARIFAGGSQQELVAQLLKTSDVKAEDIRAIAADGRGNSFKKSKPEETKMNLSLLADSSMLILLMRWTGLLVLGWGTHWLLRHGHARWRLILWRGILCLGLALPLTLFVTIPGIKIPVESRPTEPASLVETSVPANNSIPAKAGTVSPVGKAAITDKSGNDNTVNPLPTITSRPIAWGKIFVVLWALGCVWGMARLAWLQWGLSRLQAGSSPAAAEVRHLAEEVGGRLGLRHKIEIRTSGAITSPFVCGVVRPTIMLPESLLQNLAPEELQAVLNHEMAHVRQHDLPWCVAWHGMRVLCWFNPLVWNVPAAHDLACEQEADRIASQQMVHEELYAPVLARLALRVLALPAMETHLTVNGSSQIARRLKLLGGNNLRAWNRWHSAAALGLVTLLFVITASCQFSKSSSAASSTVSPHMEFEKVLVVVQDDVGKPIEGATVLPTAFRVKGIHGADWYSWNNKLFGPPEKAVTDSDGKAYVRYPVESIPEEKEYTGALILHVTHPDFVPALIQTYAVDTSGKYTDEPVADPDHPIHLARGIQLKVSGYMSGDHQAVRDLAPIINEDLIESNDWQKTDQGAYVLNKMSPGEHLIQLMGRLPSGQIVYSDVVELNAEKGQDYHLDLEMKPGVRLEGRLDDQVARPVKNGRVLICVRPREYPAWTNWNQVDAVFKKFAGYSFWRSSRPIAADGTFVFESVPAGSLDVIACGDGFASKDEGFYARNFAVPQVFKLEAPTTTIEVATEPTATLKFTALTKGGKPIAGAKVYLNPNVIRIGGIFGNMKHDSESPYVNLAPLPDIEYTGTTGTDGVAMVENVPASTGGLDVYDPQYQVPLQDIKGWRNRYVHTSFKAGMTNDLVMVMEPKGADYIGERAWR